MKFRSLSDDTSNKIKNILKTISLSNGKIKLKRNTEVYLGLNKRSSSYTGCSMNNGISSV